MRVQNNIQVKTMSENKKTAANNIQIETVKNLIKTME